LTLSLELKSLSELIKDPQKGSSSDFLSSFRSTKNIWVYQSNLFNSVKEVLSDYYPTVFKVVGTLKFKLLVSNYLKTFGVKEDSLDLIGVEHSKIIDLLEVDFSSSQISFLRELSALDFILNHPEASKEGSVSIEKESFLTYLQLQDEAFTLCWNGVGEKKELLKLKWTTTDGKLEFDLS